MTWFKTNNLAKLKTRVWSVALLVVLTISSARPRSGAQTMQKGISVELAPTRSAVPVPDADNQDALIITVTDTGGIYFGVDPVASESLGEMLKGRLSQRTQNLYQGRRQGALRLRGQSSGCCTCGRCSGYNSADDSRKHNTDGKGGSAGRN
jgi:hypothetical protein